MWFIELYSRFYFINWAVVWFLLKAPELWDLLGNYGRDNYHHSAYCRAPAMVQLIRTLLSARIELNSCCSFVTTSLLENELQKVCTLFSGWKFGWTSGKPWRPSDRHQHHDGVSWHRVRHSCRLRQRFLGAARSSRANRSPVKIAALHSAMDRHHNAHLDPWDCDATEGEKAWFPGCSGRRHGSPGATWISCVFVSSLQSSCMNACQSLCKQIDPLVQGFPTFFAARIPLSGQSILSTPQKILRYILLCKRYISCSVTQGSSYPLMFNLVSLGGTSTPGWEPLH